MRNEIIFSFIYLLSVLLSAFSQILLKKSANIKYNGVIYEYLNKYVITAYILLFGATLITVTAFRFIPFSLGPVLESMSYFFVPVLSFFFLGEKVSGRKKIGICIILLGILLFSLG